MSCEPDTRATFPFSLVVTGGTAVDRVYPLPGSADMPCGLAGIEASFTVTSKSGAGVTPVLDCSIQSSPDNFATAGLIKDLIVFTQATATTSGETKQVSENDAAVANFGAYRRLHLVADTASGDVTFGCTVEVILKCR